jgi:hypothetical protein
VSLAPIAALSGMVHVTWSAEVSAIMRDISYNIWLSSCAVFDTFFSKVETMHGPLFYPTSPMLTPGSDVHV